MPEHPGKITDRFRRVAASKKPNSIQWLLLAGGMGIALSPEIRELSGWAELEHPSHFSDIMAAICGALVAWCSRFVDG